MEDNIIYECTLSMKGYGNLNLYYIEDFYDFCLSLR